ncbi:gamma-glutamyl hydrolase 2-like [Neltuma alba]|uniref:gamma-glutamyl hydrolase 2-like n=1 Tax=Neltuma alba TaxID=207710 RepID=UPI0010A4CCEF|nr:gamma-glutamyl hydrolase 2-like [Prosopis alba]
MIDPIPPESSPHMANDVVRSSSSFTTTTFLSYIRIPILISFLICFGPGEAHDILLPSQCHDDWLPQLSSSCPAPNPHLYDRPVIGIVTHPGDGASGRLSNATNASYIAASYVKFVECAGARVIPLIYNEPSEALFKKLELVNGVLFTGGWVKNGSYFETVKKIFKKVLEKNDGGNHFPLYGICLGFELISMIVSEDHNILEGFSALNQATKLDFFTENLNGSLFQRFPPDLLRKLSTDYLVMQNHRCGISPARLRRNEKLSDFFEILTTCTDEHDKVYVSTVRSRNYPVTGFQWHPEKNAFEWAVNQNIPHTEDAILVTQQAANFLVSEARKSRTRPDGQEVLDNLIYNYQPTYSGRAG